MIYLSGELFFVSAVCFFAMAAQATVPRWTLLVPLAQVSYNLKNTLLWLVLNERFLPTGMPLAPVMQADAVFIYATHFFSGPAEARAKTD
mmetsp:Transcript_44284/g.139054  ORF Transcript_44284/g.139054 Transcript_44284/m.139054 type:complete len:90 (+) Transcript_44284:918-1187(+)